MSDGKHDTWVRGGGHTFGEYFDTDECLHPEATIPGDALTETWAYMWYLPEHNIECFAFVWVHPNLKVLTGGIAVWQGHKVHHISAELFDFHAYLSAENMGDGRDTTLANGMRVEIIEPFKRIRLRYEDPSRDTSIDVEFTDRTPPVMRGQRTHFDQAINTKGAMRLRGKAYEFDGYGLRDRSWGELRPEHPYPIPPYEWLTGTFPEADISWHVSAHDNPSLNPEWGDLYKVAPEDVFKDGWVWRDKELLRLKEASIQTWRDPATLRPARHLVTFTDEKGRDYRIEGEVVASMPWSSWHNSVCHLCMTRWQMGDLVGYGDTQEVQWGDFVHAMRGDQVPPPSERG